MRRSTGLFSVLAVMTLYAFDVAEGGIIYVDDDGPADYDHIQTAIDATVSGRDEIIVRPGTYFERINLQGKAVTVRSIDPLNPAVVESTIVDGGAAGTVVTCRTGEGPDTVLSGLTITNGRHINIGGGMGISGSPRVIHCRIINNRAIGRGAGVSTNSSPSFTHCTFADNAAQAYGGGLYIEGGNPALIHCTFLRNTAQRGGGIDLDVGSVTLTNCTFVQNSTSTYGGGVHVLAWDSYPVNITNCVFVGNHAGLFGGGIASWDVPYPECYPHVYMVNCTFAGNGTGGGRSVACNSSATYYQLNNCILWEADGIHCSGGATVGVYYSDVMGGWGPGPLIDADPLFISNPGAGPDGQWGTADDDYGDLHLQAGSPCIDAGRNTDVPADTFDLDNDGNTTERTPFDLDGHPRFLDDRNTADTGVPEPPDYPDVVDMGAYEYQAPVLPPPLITTAVSRKTHGSAGDMDIDVKTPGALECRQTGPTTIVVTFDQPVQRAGGTPGDVSVSSGTVDALVISGNQLTITMSGVADAQWLTVGFPGISNMAGQMVSETLCFGALAGDVTSDRKVNVLDLLEVKGSVNRSITTSNFRKDVDADGNINVLDLLATKTNLNKAIAGSCP